MKQKRIISFFLVAIFLIAVMSSCDSKESSSSVSSNTEPVVTEASIEPSTQIGINGEVNVYNWVDYLSMEQYGFMDVVSEFENETKIKVNLSYYDSNAELYSMLSNNKTCYDVVFPSDYMVSKLIDEDLIQEINFDNIPNFKYISDNCRNTMFDPENKYTVCYSWGVTALVYNKNMVKEKPTGWDALWNKDYSGEILMFNDYREAMAIAMQQSGLNPTNCNKSDVDKAVVKLNEQKPLLKNYVMDMVFNEMEGDMAAIAPYYAGDIAIMLEENENLSYCLPENGSHLYYDFMCIPTGCRNKENAEAFINFLQNPRIAAENCKYLRYSTPNTEAKEYLDDDIKNDELTFPPKEYLDMCYCIPCYDDEINNYMQEAFLSVMSGS